MANVLIIGAMGAVGQKVRKYFLKETSDKLTLMARNTSMLSIDEKRERIVQGDVIDDRPLYEALKGNEIVVMAMDSNLAQSTQRILNGMDALKIKRIIFVTSMGVYNEIPVKDGASGNLTESAVIQPYREAASMIESSDMNYTIVRPGEFDDSGDTNYEVTHKGDEAKGQDVSIDSVADFVIRLANDEKMGSRESLGISRKQAQTA